MRSTIPLDVFEEIIAHLPLNGYALRNCALLCKSVLPLCQKILFSTIDLSHVSSQRTYVRLALVFLGRPHISSYVKSLAIYILPKLAFRYSPFPVPDQCDALCRIFQTFTQLQNLTIVVHIQKWKKASDSVETLVHHLLASPNLSAVEFIGDPDYYIPLSFIDKLNHICDVTITRMSLVHPGKGSGSMEGTKITSLSLNSIPEPSMQALANIAVDPNISLDLSSLSSLHITAEGFADSGYRKKSIKHFGVSEILKTSSKSLTQFSWSSDQLSSLPMLESINGSPLHAVKSIKIKFTAADNFLLNAQLKAATTFFSTIPTSGFYEISFDCIWLRWHNDNIAGWNSRKWKALANTLTQRNANLKVRVFLGNLSFGGGGLPELRDYVDECVFAFGQNLSSLDEKKVLSVEVFWSWGLNQHFVTTLQEKRNSFSFTRRM